MAEARRRNFMPHREAIGQNIIAEVRRRNFMPHRELHAMARISEVGAPSPESLRSPTPINKYSGKRLVFATQY